MRIVLKADEVNDAALRDFVILAEKAGLPRAHPDQDSEYSYSIIEREQPTRIRIYFEAVDEWHEVISSCLKFLEAYSGVLLALTESTSVYFDIGVDNSEINTAFYYEFILPHDFISVLAEKKLTYVVTLYQDTSGDS